jgi:hypothetical protein
MTRLVVVHDEGSVSPVEAFLALRDVAELVFVAGPSDHARRLVPVMARIGPVCPLEDDLNATALAIKSHHPDGIVTFSERMVPTTGKLADRLGLLYHSPEVVRRLTDKAVQRDRLRQAGVDQTCSAVIQDVEQWDTMIRRVGLPAVLKPVVGDGARDTYRIDGMEEGRGLAAALLDRYRAVGGLQIEELLVGANGPYGDQVSVEILVQEGNLIHIAVSGCFPLLPPFRIRGHFWPSALNAADLSGVRTLAERALLALGVRTGMTHTEIKLTRNGPRIIEVNGRLGGYINNLSIRSGGDDLARVAGLVALGHRPSLTAHVPDQVYWTYCNLAPSGKCRFLDVVGVRGLLECAGVTGYASWIRRGEPVTQGVMAKPLSVIHGVTPSHAEMIAQIGRALETLAFRFDFPSGERVVFARDLAEL